MSVTKVLQKSVDSVVKFYCDENKEDVVSIISDEEKVSFDEDLQTLSFDVDMITDEVPVVVIFKGEKQCRVDVNGKIEKFEGNDLKDLFGKVMNKLIERLDAVLDNCLEEGESPKTPDTKIEKGFPDQTTKVLLIEDEEVDEKKAEYLETLVGVAKHFFGKKYASHVYGKAVVKIMGSGKIVRGDYRKLFGLHKGHDFVTVSLFCEGPFDSSVLQEAPKIGGQFFGNDIFGWNAVGGKRVANIVREFVNSRWESLDTSFTNLENLSFINEEISKETKGSTSKSVVRKAMEIMVTKWIKKGFVDFAKSLCLYFCEMNIKNALKMYVDSGGKIDKTDFETLKKHDKIGGKTNFVMESITYLCLRMKTFVELCCICGKRIECFPSEKRVPTVCTGKCVGNYLSNAKLHSIPLQICPRTLSVDIELNPNIVDMLISFCYSGATSNQRNLCFEPFPSSFVSGDGTRNYKSLEKCVTSLPSVV